MDASGALRTPSSTHRLLLVTALLGGFALRLYRLGAESLWYDEAVSVWLAQKPIAAMVAHTAGDIHPPGYYLLLHLWQIASAPSPARGLEYLYGWVSVAGGIAMLALLWVVGRRLIGAPAALAGVAVAALHPYHVWYAQEVRMYTVGGALALLALWAALRWVEGGQWRRLALYVVSAAAGLYTLYYFAFVIVGIGAALLVLRPAPRRYLLWLGAHIGVALLFGPWLPILWRQAMEPPVPPWRAAWMSAGEVWAALSEALTALVIGQTPVGPLWVWAVAALGVAAIALALASHRRGVMALLLFIAAPTALLFAVSLWGPPLYHVRYLFPFAATFPLVMGAALAGIGARSRVAGWAGGALFLLVYALSLRTFWVDPAYRADDHRGAVRTLAQGWRPGDVIFANAGWIAPLLEVYWPQAGDGDAAVPPPLAAPLRLLDVASGARLEADTARVPVVRGGSVGGSTSLGWGNPASDFFAISPQDTTAALARMQNSYRRLWHYRLYDTVSDPDGVVRTWLDSETSMLRDEPIPGRDYGRIELRDFDHALAPPDEGFVPVNFDGSVHLQDAAWPPTIAAGHMLYIGLVWKDDGAAGGALNMSLRLNDGDGAQVAQADGPLEAMGAVGAPPWLPPGPYTLHIVVYNREDGAPLAVDDSRASDGQQVRLGQVQVQVEQ
jgi:hypothetical protein